jgi:enediyne biosynthesis protein E3
MYDALMNPVQDAWSRLLTITLRLHADEVRVGKRGFQVDDPAIVRHLESIGTTFLSGYNAAIGCRRLEALSKHLERSPTSLSGFAHEGAAMGLAVTDWLTPGRNMFARYIQGPANRHEYMAWVGLGWALARLPVVPHKALSKFQGLHKWLALDGYGFHDGYFKRRNALFGKRPAWADNQHACVFDQGLGRSIWFVVGAHPSRIAALISTFGEDRHCDLWAGAGLACAYAGPCEVERLQQLKVLAGPNFCALAQGIVFAAQARRRAGNHVPHTETACNVLLAVSSESAADLALQSLPGAGDGLTKYQEWRYAIQRHFSSSSSHS